MALIGARKSRAGSKSGNEAKALSVPTYKLSELRLRPSGRRLFPREILRSFPEGYVLLDFLHYTHFSAPKDIGPLHQERQLLVFVLRRDAAPVCVSLGSYGTIRDLIQSWQKALHDRFEHTTQEGRRALVDRELINRPKEIGSFLLPKLKDYLQGAKALMVASDGALCRFPFAILPGLENNAYLIQNFPIGYVTSGRHAVDVFASNHKNRSVEGIGFLGVGGIDYGDLPGESSANNAASAWDRLRLFPKQAILLA